MFCSKCGVMLENNTKFCRECGTPVVAGGNLPVQGNLEARWESRSIQVHPAFESEYIEVFETFGWELLSTQTIDRKDSHLENFMGNINSVTESEKYVKLAFRRNKNMKNYKRIAELQEKYEAAVSVNEPEDASVLLLLGGIFLSVIGLFIIGIPIIGVYVYKKIKYHKNYNAYMQKQEELRMIRYECLEEVEKLV